MKDADVKRVAAMMKKSAKIKMNCILCEKRTRNRAVFVPSRSQDFGAPVHKDRVMIYAICNDHIGNDKETLLRIERALLRSIQEERESN